MASMDSAAELPVPQAAASPMSMSDCLTSSGRSGQTAIASRSSLHEPRSNASLFAVAANVTSIALAMSHVARSVTTAELLCLYAIETVSIYAVLLAARMSRTRDVETVGDIATRAHNGRHTRLASPLFFALAAASCTQINWHSMPKVMFGHLQTGILWSRPNLWIIVLGQLCAGTSLCVVLGDHIRATQVAAGGRRMRSRTVDRPLRDQLFSQP